MINTHKKVTRIEFDTYLYKYERQIDVEREKLKDGSIVTHYIGTGAKTVNTGDRMFSECYIPVDPFTVTEVETDIDHTVIAKYVGKDPESMRQLKRKWESTGIGLWIHYVRSYKYSLGGHNGDI